MEQNHTDLFEARFRQLEETCREQQKQIESLLQSQYITKKIELGMLKSFINEYTIFEPGSKVRVKVFNLLFVKYAKAKGGLYVPPHFIESLMNDLSISRVSLGGEYYYNGLIFYQ